MGRLEKSGFATRLLRQFKLWAPPVVIGGVLIVVANFALADPAPPPTELEQYLHSVELTPHSEVVNGYQQVYYYYNDQKVFVTNDSTNHTSPKSSGRYMTWIGSTDDLPGQIYFYDVLTDTTLRLSGFGTNSSPDLDGNRVVWEQWNNGSRQVAYYNGLDVAVISSGYNSFRPRISGNKIAYVQYVPDDPSGKLWHVIEYDTDSGQSSLILTTSDGAQASPHFTDGGQLKTDYDLDYLSD